MIALLFIQTLLVSVTDLLSAWLYAGNPDSVAIDLLRGTREGLTLLLAAFGLSKARSAGLPAAFAALYVLMIAAYLAAGSSPGREGIAVASAARLALPIVLLAVGYGALATPAALQAYAVWLAGLACISTAFGAWDIKNTEFWTQTLEFGHYLAGVKGIVTGFDSYYVLPHNFFGFMEQRRAAGMVAAPLAQGTFVAVGTLAGFAVLRRRSFILAAAVLATGMLGVWQSGTRGAMLMMAVTLPLYLLISGRGAMMRNMALLALLAAGTFQSLSYVYSYSANLEDGSTIGHVEALQRNLADLDQVLLTGPGLGASGSVAADAGMEIAGGGEGALFAVIYQIGLPGGVVFMLFYLSLAARAMRNQAPLWAADSELRLMSFALLVGASTSLISSDLLLALSGMGTFWILMGGMLAQGRVREAAGKVAA